MGQFVLILEKMKIIKNAIPRKKSNLKFQAANDVQTSQSCKTFLYNNPFGPWVEFFIYRKTYQC